MSCGLKRKKITVFAQSLARIISVEVKVIIENSIQFPYKITTGKIGCEERTRIFIFRNNKEIIYKYTENANDDDDV